MPLWKRKIFRKKQVTRKEISARPGSGPVQARDIQASMEKAVKDSRIIEVREDVSSHSSAVRAVKRIRLGSGRVTRKTSLSEEKTDQSNPDNAAQAGRNREVRSRMAHREGRSRRDGRRQNSRIAVVLQTEQEGQA